MKKIKIYLIANELEVEQDRIDLENFIKELNNRYNKGYEIYFELINDENFEKIDEEKIKDSELFYILFCNEMDRQNIDKFNIAYNNFIENLTPKITTYIKNSDKPTGESVNEFLERIDKELGHYHSVYSNVDTIKLNLILKLQNLELQLGDLETKDGKLFIGNQEIMSIENIPMILNNGNLNNLKAEVQELEEKYWNLREEVRKNETEENLAEYRKVAARRKKAKEEIFELEKNIIDLENSFVGMSTKGRLSHRQIYAKKCLDAGKIEEAKKALDFEKIKAEAEKILQFKEDKKEELRININELIQRVDTLKLDVTNENRFEEIEKTFEEAIRIEKEGGLYRETLIIYAAYLFVQNKFQKSIEYLEVFENYSKIFDVNKNNLLSVYSRLGLCYKYINQFDKSEEYNQKSLEICEELKEENPQIYTKDLARIKLNIADFYRETNKYTRAEELYQDTIKLQKELINANFDLYSEDLASSYNNLGLSYLDSNKYDKAEGNFKEAIKLLEKLTKEDWNKYAISLANSYNNIALVYLRLNEYKKSKEYYKKSLEIQEKLVKENPDAYSATLALLYNNMGLLDFYNKNFGEAETNYKKAIELDEKQSKITSEAYDKDLALFYDNISILYVSIKQHDKAKIYLQKGLDTHERLAKNNPEVYNGKLINSYASAINLYCKTKQYDKAEKYCQKAIDFGEELIKENPDVYKGNLAIIYNDLGYVYWKTRKYKKSEECYKKALKLCKELIDVNNTEYNKTLGMCYYMLAMHKLRIPLIVILVVLIIITVYRLFL